MGAFWSEEYERIAGISLKEKLPKIESLVLLSNIFVIILSGKVSVGFF
jgi:hypothetical protein